MELQILRSSLQMAMDFLKEMIIKELRDQGHKASGKLENSVRVEIEATEDGFIGRIWIEDYAFILDRGVSASRVPYNPGSGARRSKYIEALIEWIGRIKPGISARERKSFAFAIAATAKKEGHPTRGSFAFSNNGRRKGWAEQAINKQLTRFEGLLALGEFVAASFESLVADLNKIIVG